MEDTPYLLRGVGQIATDSPVLVSSSPYLNNPSMRDWVATHYLRRSSKVQPTPSDMLSAGRIILDCQDLGAIEDMIAQERERYPALDQWFRDGFVSTFTKQDLAQYEPDTVGGIFHRYLTDFGFEIDIIPRFEPKTQYLYYMLRSGQIHDFEHIICGGGFDTIGELVPYYMRLANVPRFLSPRLAEQLNAAMTFGSVRIFMRTALHYHEAFPTALEAIQRGLAVGQQSGPMFMAKYEDVFHLTVPEARRALGVVGAVDVDTGAASRVWEENQ